MHRQLRKKMAEGTPLLGILSLVHHPTVVELAGWCGADYIVIDGEHATLSDANLGAIVRAAEIAGIVPVVRVFMKAGSDLLPYLDLGFRGVMVPHLKTVEQAREMVSHTQFPPRGQRSISPGRISTHYVHPQSNEDLDAISDSILVIAQIEDVEAVDCFDDLLAVEGVDIFNIGAADLAGSLGFPGEPSNSHVRGTMAELVRKAGEKGCFTGNPGWDQQTRGEFFSKGARSFLVPDTVLLTGAIRAKRRELDALSSQQQPATDRA